MKIAKRKHSMNTRQIIGPALMVVGFAAAAISAEGAWRRIDYPDYTRRWPQMKGVMLGSSTEKEFKDLRAMGANLVRYQMNAGWKQFADDIAYAQFLHDASEIGVEHHGKAVEHKQDFYESGCERKSYFKLPAVKPNVLIPVIEVMLK